MITSSRFWMTLVLVLLVQILSYSHSLQRYKAQFDKFHFCKMFSQLPDYCKSDDFVMHQLKNNRITE